jgi:serine/threonine protein kinase
MGIAGSDGFYCRIISVSLGRDFIGPFQLLRFIRAGSTASVWEAIRTGEKERIALKILLEKYRKDKDAIAALKHEAVVGGELSHPSVIKIFGYHEDLGYPLISMQLFNSKNLKLEMRERPDFMLANISPIIRNCAKGLAHMHQKGWVHCDIKPDNFLADEQSNVKLIDFSIALKSKKTGGLSSLFGGGKLKQIKGTRSYISPEQIRRVYPDQRADIYGFGCMVFELLSGRAPYTANSPEELLQKHLTAPLPTLESCSDASPDFAELVRKMIAKKPEDRFQSMDDFLVVFEKTQIFRPGKRPAGFRR